MARAIAPDAEADACLKVARQMQSRYASVDTWPEYQRKLGGLLQRRGFTWETVGPILQQGWSERGGAGEAEDE